MNRFHLFNGEKFFTVLAPCKMELYLSTEHARQRMAKQGSAWNGVHSILGGTLDVPAGTRIELLKFDLPDPPHAWIIKIKFDGRQAIGNLGVFYAYTNIKSLENVELEPTR